MKAKLPTISSILMRGLLIRTIAIFLLMTLSSIAIQYHMARNEAGRLLKLTIRDVCADIRRASDEKLLGLAYRVASVIETDGESELRPLCALCGVNEINIVDGNGVIVRSSNEDLIGYDMRSGPQSSAFIALLDGAEEFVQPLGPISYDPSILRKYAGVALPGGGFVQVGYNYEALKDDLAPAMEDITSNRHIMETGLVFIIDPDENIISLRGDLTGEQVRQILARRNIHGAPNTLHIIKMFGQWHYWMYDSMGVYSIIAALPQQEVLSAVRLSAVMTAIMGVLLFAMLYGGIRLLDERVVVRQVKGVADTLSAIAAGNLDAEVSVRSTLEFDIISDGINATVSTLKEHIAREKARIEAELGYARLIQQSALPALTEPFTSSPAFELYACMSTAKEVGGDFYDFYMLDDHTLAFLVADVSDKGIPAAMFMMTGKATLHDCVERASDIGEGFVKANERLCARNDAEMFITAWMGLLDLETGEVTFANAGHTPPILIRDGKAACLKMEPDMILAVMDDVEYQSQRLKLRPSDVLYLYTDGVTEAVSAARELYGEARLLQTLSSFSSGKAPDCEALCRHVADSLDLFAKGEPQADDITMLCLRYKAPLNGTGLDLVLSKPKHPYMTIIRHTEVVGDEVIGYENFPAFPIVPLYGSKARQSSIIGLRASIDAYDLILSGFANNVQDCARIYRIIENCGGMDADDMRKFLENIRYRHIATADTQSMGAEGSSLRPYTQDVPFRATLACLEGLREQMYEDFCVFDPKIVQAGNVTATQIMAGYQPMDEEADAFEYQIIEFLQKLLALKGLEAMPIFKRNRITNQTEEINAIIVEAKFLDHEAVLDKLPNITPDEKMRILSRKD